MALVQKPNGTWYVVLYIPGGGGTRRWIKAGKSKRAARSLELELTTKVHRGEFRACQPIGFTDFADKWLTDYVQVALKPVTQREYAGYLKNYWKPSFGNRKLSSIQTDDIQRHVALLAREGKLKPKSMKNQVACLGRLMRTAVEWGYLNTNPVKNIAFPKDEHREMRFLTPEQMRALVLASKHRPMEHAALALACGTGMRKSEIRGCLVSSLDLSDNPSVTVRTTVVGNTDDIVQSTKTKAGHRTIPLPPYVADALMSWLMVAPESPNGLLFCRKDGRPLRAEWFNDCLTRNARKAGVPVVTVHQLRHSWVAACLTPVVHPTTGETLKPPLSLPVLQRLAGHNSVQTTISVYGHLLPEATKAAASHVQSMVFEMDETPF